MTNQDMINRKHAYFERENELKDVYLSLLDEPLAERKSIINQYLYDNEISDGALTFLRWLGDKDWFLDILYLYEHTKQWNKRANLMMTAMQWSRSNDMAYELAIKGLKDRSTQVISRALEALAYSLEPKAISHVLDLKKSIIVDTSNKKDWLMWYVDGSIGAIEKQDHHWLLSRGDVNTHWIIWPWDNDDDYQYILSMNVSIDMLKKYVRRRLIALDNDIEDLEILHID